MLMKYIAVMLFTFCFAFQVAAGSHDTLRLYFDSNWQQAEPVNASYFRNYYRKGALWMTKDYFISGKLQMSGAFSDDSFKVHEGQFIYYREDGSPSKSASYIHNKEEG